MVEDISGFVIIELDFFVEHFKNVIFRKSLEMEKKWRNQNRMNSSTRVKIVNPLVSDCICGSLRNVRRPIRESTAMKEKNSFTIIMSNTHIRVAFIL